jgi:hypothetical protein
MQINYAFDNNWTNYVSFYEEPLFLCDIKSDFNYVEKHSEFDLYEKMHCMHSLKKYNKVVE